MKDKGHHWMQGVWLYGDLHSDVGHADTPDQCADECESEPKCLHWSFDLVQHRCGLRGEGGFHDSGPKHFVTGHAKRWDAYQKEKARRTGRKVDEL